MSLVLRSSFNENFYLYSLLVLLLANFGCDPTPKPVKQYSLPIQEQYQETPEWCWVSVCQMVLQFNHVGTVNPAGDYQCGIVGWYFQNTACYSNCYLCRNNAAQSLDDILRVYSYYPATAKALNGGVGPSTITYNAYESSLGDDQIMAQIDAGSPIEAGINPDGYIVGPTAQHATLIIGYIKYDDGSLDVIVNDPFPYQLTPYPNPYFAAGGQTNGNGQYQINSNNFRGRLLWEQTVDAFTAVY